jgi:mycothiol synthase
MLIISKSRLTRSEDLGYSANMSNDNHSVNICPVLSGDIYTALELVFSYLPLEQRTRQIEPILSAIAGDGHARGGLLAAYRSGALVGAVFSQIMPGKNAQVWPPRLVQNEETSTAAALLQATVRWLEKCQVCMAQMILETVTAEDEKIFRDGGFDYLTSLLYLVCLENDFPHVPLNTPLVFEPYTSEKHDRLAQIVESTYRDTLDTPKLNQARQLEDVLEGYRETGVFSPDRWLIVRHENRDVGCLLLADHPQYENMELVYMGLIPAVRGHSWGTDIARHAQHIAKQTGRPRLVVAVDDSNGPAIRMYASVGFNAWDQRRVYYRLFPER